MFGKFICNYEAHQSAILDIENIFSGNHLPYSDIINQSELFLSIEKKRKNSIDPYIEAIETLEKSVGLIIWVF